MNYCIVAFAIWLIIATIQWFIDGKKNYHGPQIDHEALKQAEVFGVPIDSHTSGGPVIDRGKEFDKTA